MSSALIELKTFLPKQKEYCLVIGVLNEGERFVNQLQQAVMHNNLVDIIIADGGSDDGSTSPDFLQDKVTAIVVDSRKLGLSAQYQEAMKFAIQHDYKGIIMVDGNGKDSMFSIPLFIEKLEQGADFVQGSRFKQGGGHKNTPSERLFAIKFVFNPLMNFFSGFKYSDLDKIIKTAYSWHCKNQELLQEAV